MNDIVTIINNTPMTTSLLIAEKFNKPHADLLKLIRKTILEVPMDFSQGNFSESEFINARGRSYVQYEMTRDAFSLIVMGLNGKKAMDWKVKFIKAFNAMESELLRKQDSIEWKQARIQSKDVRRSVTDTIADFVKYAELQGSRSASMYYANITKMEYKALELIAKNEKVSKGFRDTLDVIDLSFLSAAEQVAKAAINQGMEQELHYKDIYQMAKAKVCSYAETVTFARLEKHDEN
ncbi:Rha family regulatory protein [Vibrio phage 1.164.O._10N.261.51.A7]|nr:Rha family regulatory protein [Vibrio phage 1.164.O._10N.261.51.A7]